MPPLGSPETDGSRPKGAKTRELMHVQHPDCFVFLEELNSNTGPYAKFALNLARSSGANLLLGGCLTNQRPMFDLGPFSCDVFNHKEKEVQELEGKRVFLTMYKSRREQHQFKLDGVPLAGRPFRTTSHSFPFKNLTRDGDKGW